MNMNKHKPHFKVTFEINLDARAHKTVEVWAATEKMALKKAEDIIKHDKNVFTFCNPSITRLST